MVLLSPNLRLPTCSVSLCCFAPTPSQKRNPEVHLSSSRSGGPQRLDGDTGGQGTCESSLDFKFHFQSLSSSKPTPYDRCTRH